MEEQCVRVDGFTREGSEQCRQAQEVSWPGNRSVSPTHSLPMKISAFRQSGSSGLSGGTIGGTSGGSRWTGSEFQLWGHALRIARMVMFWFGWRTGLVGGLMFRMVHHPCAGLFLLISLSVQTVQSRWAEMTMDYVFSPTSSCGLLSPPPR